MSKFYPDDPVREKACRNYLANLRRRARAPGKRSPLPVVGGPYDGQRLSISSGVGPWDCYTATTRVGDQVGRYKAYDSCHIDNPHDDYALIWEPEKANAISN